MSGLTFALSDVTSFLPDNVYGLKKLYSGLPSSSFINNFELVFIYWDMTCNLFKLSTMLLSKPEQDFRLNLWKYLHLHISINFRRSHQMCSIKKVFLKISQNLQENTCSRISLLITCRPQVLFYRTPPGDCFWNLCNHFRLMQLFFLDFRNTFRWVCIRCFICYTTWSNKNRHIINTV